MRLVCVPSLFILISLIAHITHAIDFTEVNSLQQQQYQQSVSDESNLDDTSLFRGVENAIDEDTEDDAYRILKSLQDVSEDDFSEEDDEEVNQMQHGSSREIKSRIQPEEEDDENEEEVEVDIEDDENEDDEEDEEDDEDFSLGPFPDFKNDATADFFEHLGQNPSVAEDEKDKEQEEEDNEEDNIENHIDIHEAEEDYNEEEEEEDVVDNKPINTNNMNNNNNNNNNNHIPIPVVLPPSQPLSPISNEENSIPWQRPDSKDRLVVNEIDNKFNQDSNYNSSFQHNKQKSTAGFRFWHGVFVLLILVIIFKSSNRKKVQHEFHYIYIISSRY